MPEDGYAQELTEEATIPHSEGPASSQKPSVGRMVHYVSHGTPVQSDDTQVFPSACRSAIITEVKNDSTVSLFVMNPTGVFFNEECSLDDGDQLGGTWHWPERV